jgi:hypothetical protein
MAGNADEVVFVPFYDFIFGDVVDHNDQFYNLSIFGVLVFPFIFSQRSISLLLTSRTCTSMPPWVWMCRIAALNPGRSYSE